MRVETLEVKSPLMKEIASPLGVRYLGPLALPERLETPINTRFEHSGVRLGPEHKRITGVFNGPLIEVVGIEGEKEVTEWHFFPRVMRNRAGRGVDITDALGHYRVDPLTYRATGLETIPVEHIRSGQPSMLRGGFNPEDLRGLVIDDNSTILFGLTAADLNGIPRAALMRAAPPYSSEYMTSMKVLDYLPPMKNILPLAPDLFVARPELMEDNSRSLSFYHNNDPVDLTTENNMWKKIGKTPFPDVAWIGKKGRLGLVGWNEKIPVPNFSNRFRILIHGYSHDADLYEYAIGIAEIETLPNGTFRFIGADNKALITYSQTVGMIKAATGRQGREPNKHKRVVYSVGGLVDKQGDIILPVTAFDSESHLFHISREEMLRQFS